MPGDIDVVIDVGSIVAVVIVVDADPAAAAAAASAAIIIAASLSCRQWDDDSVVAVGMPRPPFVLDMLPLAAAAFLLLLVCGAFSVMTLSWVVYKTLTVI